MPTYRKKYGRRNTRKYRGGSDKKKSRKLFQSGLRIYAKTRLRRSSHLENIINKLRRTLRKQPFIAKHKGKFSRLNKMLGYNRLGKTDSLGQTETNFETINEDIEAYV